MKRRIIHDDQALLPERRQQHLLNPCCHRQMCAACLEQHGRDPILAPLPHDEIGPLMVVAGDFTKDLVAPRGPAMRPVNIGLKSALIKINHIFPAMNGYPGAQLAQKGNSFIATTFAIPRRFF